MFGRVHLVSFVLEMIDRRNTATEQEEILHRSISFPQPFPFKFCRRMSASLLLYIIHILIQTNLNINIYFQHDVHAFTA